jgi:hypothetical protein
MAHPPGEVASSNHLIESHRVEGTPVFDPHGRRIGTVRHLVIEKVSGRVAYVVVTFGGFFGIGANPHPIPWEKLKYDTKLHGYRTDITQAQLQKAPVSYGDEKLWCDHRREQTVRDYWDVPPFRF